MENAPVLDADLTSAPAKVRRRKLLPWWIKIFAWIFMIMGAVVPFGLIGGLLGYSFQLGLYGIQTFDPLSVEGLLVSALLILKGFAAFGLWFEKDWAIVVAKTDGIIGILICVFMMTLWLALTATDGDRSLTFRVEILLLIPYVVKVNRMGKVWR